MNTYELLIKKVAAELVVQDMPCIWETVETSLY